MDQEFLLKIAQFNPKLRILIILNDFDFSSLVENVFELAWKYKILNIYAVDYLFPSQIYAYNPFDKALHTFSVNNINYATIQNFEHARIRNLKGYKLKVTFFNSFLVSDGKTDENGNFLLETLRFPDGEAVKLLSKLANFTVEFVKSKDGFTYGWKAKNGTYTGEKIKVLH